MFNANNPSRETVVLDFGGAPQESFAGLVKVDEVPEYLSVDATSTPLKLSAADQVEDDATALFKALGLS